MVAELNGKHIQDELRDILVVHHTMKVEKVWGAGGRTLGRPPAKSQPTWGGRAGKGPASPPQGSQATQHRVRQGRGASVLADGRH